MASLLPRIGLSGVTFCQRLLTPSLAKNWTFLTLPFCEGLYYLIWFLQGTRLFEGVILPRTGISDVAFFFLFLFGKDCTI